MPAIWRPRREKAELAAENGRAKVWSCAMKLRLIFLLAMLVAQLCPGVELRDLKVLYVGNTKTRPQ